LKGFFDNVETDRVIQFLKSKGLTEEYCHELERMSKSYAKLPAVQPLDETNEKRKGFWFGTINTYLKRKEVPS